MTRIRKIILWISITVLLGIGVFVLLKKFYFEPNLVNEPLATTTNTTHVEVENPTTTSQNLKTYRNEEWGFEFEYPDGWSFHENTFYSSASKLNLIGASPEENNNPNPVRPSILINIVTPDFAEKAAMDRKKIGATSVNISIDSVLALKYQYVEQISKISIDIPRDQYNFIISSSQKYEIVLNQILSSFQFIEK